MKYIKTFENQFNAKYHIGDYVLFDDDQIMLITDIDLVQPPKIGWGEVIQYEGAHLKDKIDKFNYDLIYIVEYRINKKLTKEEVDFYLTTKKYNL